MRIHPLPIVVGLTLGLSSVTQAQSSEYFLVDSRSGVLTVIQNGAVVRTWNQRFNAMPIAVSGTVRTYAEFTETGSEYDLMGNWTGTDYPFTSPANQKVDGATDGVQNNWLAAWTADAIYQTDLDWQNPTMLFSVPGGPTGVAYDGSTGNLWVIEYTGGLVVEYDLTGKILSSFTYNTPSGWMGCLAWEPATDTLWGTDFSSGDVLQHDKAGNLLQSFVVPSLVGYAWGGEFDVDTACRARWSNYGQGFPGTLGVPGLTASNPPVIGQSITLTADNSEGTNRIGGFLVMGLAQIQVPGSWGGDLLVSPLFFKPVSIPVIGLVLGGVVPNDPGLCDISAYLQVLEFDPGAANGISNTAGLQLIFGN